MRIIDKTAEPGTTSRALAVQARTLEFYHQVGLADAVIAGLRDCGLTVWRTGLGPSPMLYFATYHLDTGSGVSRSPARRA